jgi:DNA (cytosine-5)-methyltransferase 1
VVKRIKGEYRDFPIIIIDPELPNAIAPTCVAHYSKDLSTRLVKDRTVEYDYGRFP